MDQGKGTTARVEKLTQNPRQQLKRRVSTWVGPFCGGTRKMALE